MAYLWTPVPGTYLIDEMENANPFSVSVTVSQMTSETLPNPNPVPQSISSVVHNLPSIVTVTIDGLTVTFSGDTLLGLFPVTIHVLASPYEDSAKTIDSWSDLQPDDQEIYQMDAPAQSYKEYPIDITAEGGSTETVRYFIRVYTDYDINADILKQEIDNRKFTPII